MAQFPPFVQFIIEYLNLLFGPASRLWPGYILAFIFIAFVIYKFERSEGGFWRYLFPSQFYSSESVATDIKLFLFNGVIRTFDVASRIGVRALVTIYVLQSLGGNIDEPSNIHPLLITLVLFLVGDFWTYLWHRINHTYEPFWVFHAVHHSAEFLVPFTSFRSHPLYGLFSRSLEVVIFGVMDGLLLALFVTSIEIHTLIGINTLSFIYAVTGNNLRHSHIWLGYGPILSRIFISPAMHQIHHSRAPKHYNKNYGGMFAIFDWAFGTLYIPKEKEELEFGIVDAQGNAIQPHNGFREAFFVPFKHLAQWYKNREKNDPNELQRARSKT